MTVTTFRWASSSRPGTENHGKARTLITDWMSTTSITAVAVRRPSLSLLRLSTDSPRCSNLREPVAAVTSIGLMSWVERLLISLQGIDLMAVEPFLRQLQVPTLIVWGTGDAVFDVKYAYWLRDTIRGVTEVVELPGAKLFFPDERAAELVTHLRRHWAAHRRSDLPASLTSSPPPALSWPVY